MTLMPRPSFFLASLARRAVGYACVLALAACAGIAGVGGSDEFGCKAPMGVRCDSVSGTYYNALQRNLPSQKKSALPDASTGPTLMDHVAGKRATFTASATKGAPLASATVTALMVTREGKAPLRSPPRVLRLWIKGWEDSDGDLHSQSYLYVPIDAGRWLIDHYRSPRREAYAPIKAPRAVKGTAPKADAAVTADSPRTGEDASLLAGSRATALERPSSSDNGDESGR